MKVYEDIEFREKMDQAGYAGWELVGVLPLPHRPTSAREKPRLTCRLIFKEPGYRFSDPPRRPYDAEKAKKAIEAESKAEQAAFQEELRKLDQRR